MSDFRQLQFHPDFRPRAVTSVQVALERLESDRLWVRYMIHAPLDHLAIPGPSDPARRDDLWKTTCFELFLRKPEKDGYVEFNFAPSKQWAAYSFSSYRNGRSPLSVSEPPSIELSAASDLLDAEVVLETPGIEGSQLSLTAVVEETDGTKSYWALAHPPEGPPDFHHPACFTLELPPPSEA